MKYLQSVLCGHVECVNYKCCDLIGTPKFLPLDQECCRFSPDALPRVAMGGVWARDYHLVSVTKRGFLPHSQDYIIPPHILCRLLLHYRPDEAGSILPKATGARPSPGERSDSAQSR